MRWPYQLQHAQMKPTFEHTKSPWNYFRNLLLTTLPSNILTKSSIVNPQNSLKKNNNNMFEINYDHYSQKTSLSKELSYISPEGTFPKKMSEAANFDQICSFLKIDPDTVDSSDASYWK